MQRLRAWPHHWLSAAALFVAACGGEPAPDEGAAEQALPLLGAPEDHTHLYSVGFCGGQPNQDPNAGEVGACLSPARRCSATLVAPNLVLTARTCVDAAQFVPGEPFCTGTFKRTPPPVSKITLDDSVLSGNPAWRDVAEVLYPNTNRFCDDNIALLVLADNVPGRLTRPAAVDVGRDLAARPPQAFTMIGRGGVALHVDPITFAVTANNGGLKRRILENIPFVCASNVDGGCSAIDITASLPDDLFLMPKSLASFGPGVALSDGGLGIIEQASFDRQRPKVMAVATLVPIGESGDPHLSVGVRTSVHKDFLVEGARHAAREGRYPVPEWARDCSHDD